MSRATDAMYQAAIEARFAHRKACALMSTNDMATNVAWAATARAHLAAAEAWEALLAEHEECGEGRG